MLGWLGPSSSRTKGTFASPDSLEVTLVLTGNPPARSAESCGAIARPLGPLDVDQRLGVRCLPTGVSWDALFVLVKAVG